MIGLRASCAGAYLQFHYKINSISVVVNIQQLNDIFVLQPAEFGGVICCRCVVLCFVLVVDGWCVIETRGGRRRRRRSVGSLAATATAAEAARPLD